MKRLTLTLILAASLVLAARVLSASTAKTALTPVASRSSRTYPRSHPSANMQARTQTNPLSDLRGPPSLRRQPKASSRKEVFDEKMALRPPVHPGLRPAADGLLR